MLLFIHHDSRLVTDRRHHVEPGHQLDRPAVTQSLDGPADQANATKFCIRDHDTKFAASFDVVFAADGTRVITTPSEHLGPTPSVSA